MLGRKPWNSQFDIGIVIHAGLKNTYKVAWLKSDHARKFLYRWEHIESFREILGGKQNGEALETH